MTVYKLDKTAADKLNARLRDMLPVLTEISPSLQILRKVLAEHQNALETPAINQYREELIEVLTQAIGYTYTVAEKVEQLTKASDQTARHLAALDDHFGNLLADKTSPKTTTTDSATAVTVKTPSLQR
jgi:hypothetical protein